MGLKVSANLFESTSASVPQSARRIVHPHRGRQRQSGHKNKSDNNNIPHGKLKP
jgi:hypothetical protein